MPAPLLIAKSNGIELALLPALANRHGLITGATGTGKTVTLQKLAEQFSAIGVPVFMADIKGDLSGIAEAGRFGGKVKERLDALKLDEPKWSGCPVTCWDVFGALPAAAGGGKGHPVRATVSDLGPLLLARLLNLNDTQSGVLQLVFKIADDNGLLLLDLKDLRAMCQHVGDNASSFTTEYGNVSAASIGAIQRGLLGIEQQGAENFFGEPMLNIDDLMQTDGNGRGVVNILAADKLLNSPKLYSTFLLWMLAELYEHLPEAGDLEKPKLVFFFDEAHLLFNEAPKALLEKIEQVVRLIRSKGVGIYFVTQNPLDVPDTVLAQLGNRVQHALRAFTPRDQKAVKAAADTMRTNPKLDTATAITELGVGEALVSFLDEKGRPCIVERAFIVPPVSQIGPIDAARRKGLIDNSIVAGVYEKTVDRASAYEVLKGRTEARQSDAARTVGGSGSSGNSTAGAATSRESGTTGGSTAGGENTSVTGQPETGFFDKIGSMFGGGASGAAGTGGGRRREGIGEAMAKSAARAIGSQVGREILRGVLGSILGGRRK